MRLIVAYATKRRWFVFVVSVATLGLIARLVISHHWLYNGADLSIYYYFSHLINEGKNPYNASANGPINPVYGDFPVLEMATYAGLLAVHDSLDTLRVFFSSVDWLTLLGIGFLSPRSHQWRSSMMLFYAFNPLVLVSWTLVPEDKTVLFALLTWILIAFDRRSDLAAWLGTSLLALYKWISIYFFLPFVLWSGRRLRRRTLAMAVGALLLALLIEQIPYFPDSLRPYGRRERASLAYPPSVGSLSRLLYEIGLYRPVMAQLSVYIALGIVYILFAKRKIDVKEAAVLAIFGSYVGLPNESFDRILLVTLPFLFLISLSRRRWIVIWVVSSVAGLWIRENIFNPGTIFGPYTSWRHFIAANAFMLLLLGYYLSDKITGRYVMAEDLRAPELVVRLTRRLGLHRELEQARGTQAQAVVTAGPPPATPFVRDRGGGSRPD